MRRTWITGLGVLALTLLGQVAQAADHQDGAAVKVDPSTDITDVYTWMSADGTKVYLVMDVFPFADKTTAKFSNTAKYVFHTVSLDKVGGTPGDLVDVVCTFDATQKISCWAVDRKNNNAVLDYVTGDASMATAPITSTHMKVFAGVRNDPFFFNLDGFKAVAAAVNQAAMANALTFDNLGCPNVSQNLSGQLVGLIKSDGNGNAGQDHFGKANVLSIVIAIDKSVLVTTNKLTTVWGSTNQ